MHKKSKPMKVTNDYVARHFASAFSSGDQEYEHFVKFRSAVITLLGQGKMTDARTGMIASRFSEPYRVLFGKTIEHFGSQTVIENAPGGMEVVNRMFIIPLGGMLGDLERALDGRYNDVAGLLRQTGYSADASNVLALPHIFAPEDIPLFAAQTLYDMSSLATELLVWGAGPDQHAALVADMVDLFKAGLPDVTDKTNLTQRFLIGFSARFDKPGEERIPDGIDLLLDDADETHDHEERLDEMDLSWDERISALFGEKFSCLVDSPIPFEDIREYLIDAYIEMNISLASEGVAEGGETLHIKFRDDGLDVAVTRNDVFITRFLLPRELLMPLEMAYFDDLALRYTVYWGDETAVMPAPAVTH